MSYFHYKYIVFLLSTLIWIYDPSLIFADNPIKTICDTNKINEFKPDQHLVNYIYSRSLDVIMRYPGIFLSKKEMPLFNPERDTVFVSPVLTNTKECSPFLLDSVNNNLRKIDCQNYFDNLSIQNTFNIYITNYSLHYENPANPNISVNFSHLFQYKNKIFIGAHIFWNIMEKEYNINQTGLVIELELCNNNLVLFRKLYANIYYLNNVPYISLKNSQNSNNTIQKETPIKDNFKIIKGKNFKTIFYEYDLPDKNCGE